MEEYDIYALGTPAIDYIIDKNTEKIVKDLGIEKENTTQVSSQEFDKILSKYSKHIFLKSAGDNARNLCEAASLLSSKCAYTGLIGKDADSKHFQRVLKQTNVKDLCTIDNSKKCGRVLTLVHEDGTRTFISSMEHQESLSSFPKINSKITFLTSITLKPDTNISKAALKYLETPFANKSMKVISLESPSMLRTHREFYLSNLKKFDLVFANLSEFEALFGHKKYEKALDYCDFLFLKMGKKGSRAYTRSKKVNIKPFFVDIVDTSGAGDYYAAGVLVGLSRGKSLEESGKLGSFLASIVVGIYGAQYTR